MRVSTRTLVFAALSAAIAFVMRQFSFPFFAAPFLKVEFSEVPVLLAGLYLGPAVGLCVQVVKDLLLFTLRGSSIWGVLSDLVCSGALILGFCGVWRRFSTSGPLRLLCASAVGVLMRCAVAIPLNYLILSIEFGYGVQYITGMMLPAIIPFNAFKSLCNIALLALVWQAAERYDLGPAPALSESRRRG